MVGEAMNYLWGNKLLFLTNKLLHDVAVLVVVKEFILDKNVVNLKYSSSSPLPHPSLKQAITCHKKLDGN